MAIEKAFAIEAEADVIWDSLWSEAQASNPSAVEAANRPRELKVRVELGGGIEALITYEILKLDGSCEVSARLEPRGSRYRLLQVMTFGRLRTHYELMLVQGLANLKQAVEGAEEEVADGP